MASIRLEAPQPFNFTTPDDWPRWKRRFEQYRQASGLSAENEGRQISTLLYCMGENAEETLSSTHISENARKKYDEVVAAFDGYFQVRKNTIFERACFNRRVQNVGESVEQFITSLYVLAENCAYGELKSEMIRDRIVVGIRDKALSERLQLDPDLTLDSAKSKVRQREAVHEQQTVLQQSTIKEEKSLDEMKHRDSRPKQKSHVRPDRRPKENVKCTRCGKAAHKRGQCPARELTCYKCNKKGHFASMCLSKKVASLVEEELETAYLNTVTSHQDSSWTAEIKVNQSVMTFKLDTGAEVTALSEAALACLGEVKIHKPEKILCGPDRRPLDVIGCITATLAYKGWTSTQSIYVIRKLTNNLLGLPAIQSLHLLKQVEGMEVLSSKSIKKKFPKLFQGLGTLKGEYKIKLNPGAKPFALSTARNIALPLRPKVKRELFRMEALGVISKVEEPTDWCAGTVAVLKPSGDVRICVDLKPLNESVRREFLSLPKVDENLAQLAGATVFSKLDANSGFWQVPLSEDSKPLTTFITPFGRYWFNKLPFGISSAPEHFQRRMNEILDGLDGILCQLDDVLIFGSDQSQHDERLLAALQRIEAAGVTLNEAKCEFSKSQLKFLGHIINQHGISADPDRTSAIDKMSTPTTRTELRRFLGMANQLAKFSPRLAEITTPLRELLSTKCAWVWGPTQEEAFTLVKEELTKPTVLSLYNPEAETIVSADASSHGLGAVLLQKFRDLWKPIVYASRALSDAETRYAQIEKEALATTWACEKFTSYLLGKKFSIQTDHKPLVPLLNSKNLDSLPPRILRFRMRMMRFDYSICHVPGKLLNTADALSRAPLQVPEDDTTSISLAKEREVEAFIEAVVASLPAKQDRLDDYKKAQMEDPICTKVITCCQRGWPQRKPGPALQPYKQVQNELTCFNDLLLYRNRIVVPESLRQETLAKIHHGHQGVVRCKLRVQESVWWPGVNRDVETYIQKFPQCAKSQTPPREPLMPTPLPSHPWERVGADLFQLNGISYLVVVDYFSRYPEVVRLSSTTSNSIVSTLKSIFSRHGIPAVLVSDNGPQFSSKEMLEFASKYAFRHITSSPRFPQSNGLAERTVKTVKSILRDSLDPYIALLSYRTTPLPFCQLSPTELLMGRKVRTDIPVIPSQLIPKWEYLDHFRHCDKRFKQRQRRDYNLRHRVRTLPDLPDETDVWIRTGNTQSEGRILTPADTPRSYLVSTQGTTIRRNRHHLQPVPEPRVIMTRSKTGTICRPPERLHYTRKGDVV